ncbi:MAG TPA: PAS domain S-box protein, partial [Chloroflexaceae bacterium]|nr:PAS domain S-box protein [Chloroflexaceae bacterium]
MLGPFLTWLDDLPYSDPVERSQAHILQAIVLLLLMVRLALTALGLVAPELVPEGLGGPAGIVFSMLLLAIVLTLRAGRLRTAVMAIVAVAIGAITSALLSAGVADHGIYAVGYVIPIALAGLVLPRPSLALVTALCVGGLAWAAAATSERADQTADNLVVFVIYAIVISLLLDSYRAAWERSIEAARASEERLRLALDAGAMGTWDWDLRDGRIIWGGHHARIVGLADGEFDGRYETFARRMHPDDLPGIEAAVEEARRNLTPFAHEYRVVWPYGTVRWAAGRGRFLPDRSGAAARMLGVIVDITEQKEAEARLRATIAERDAALARLQLVLDRTPIGVIINGADFTISYWNPAAERIFGWSAAEMVGSLPDETFLVEEVRARLPAIRRQISTSQTTLFVESQNRRKDGALISCEWHNTPLHDEAGAFTGFLAMVQDVTERRRREQEVRELNAELELRVAARTAELAAKNRELEVFAYSVSHDLKAPLRGIDGYSRLLEEEFAGRLDGEGPYYIAQIRAGAASMAELIDDLLAYSRVERRTLRLRGVAVGPLAEQVCAEFAEQLAQA